MKPQKGSTSVMGKNKLEARNKSKLTKPLRLSKMGTESMKRFSVEASRGRFKICGFVQEVGQDILVSVWGGTRPHIGAVGIAVPRHSLKNPKKWSATSSNFTFPGHKEDTLVKRISERLAGQLRKNVVVTAGIHWDSLTVEEIKTIENLTGKLSDRILEKLLPAGKGRRR
jgi:gallate decarboxylase subunit D